MRAGAEAVERADVLLMVISEESSDDGMNSNSDTCSSGRASPDIASSSRARLEDFSADAAASLAADAWKAEDELHDMQYRLPTEAEAASGIVWLPITMDVLFTVELRRHKDGWLSMHGRLRNWWTAA